MLLDKHLNKCEWSWDLITINELSDYGITKIDNDEIPGFLSSQSVGVLGLPTADAPVMRPLSFAYDGESRVYFLYILGSESRKEDLSDRADVARFLVQRGHTV